MRGPSISLAKLETDLNLYSIMSLIIPSLRYCKIPLTKIISFSAQRLNSKQIWYEIQLLPLLITSNTCYYAHNMATKSKNKYLFFGRSYCRPVPSTTASSGLSLTGKTAKFQGFLQPVLFRLLRNRNIIKI